MIILRRFILKNVSTPDYRLKEASILAKIVSDRHLFIT